MPRIPISPKDLPTQADRFKPLNETLTYRGTIEMLGAIAQDKNEHQYFSIRIRITEPEEAVNRIVYDNYIPLPWPVADWMDAKQRLMAEQSGDKLGDIARAADIEPDPDGSWDTDELLNKEILFTIRNEEYQGNLRPRPQTYLLPKDQVPF